MNSKFSKGFILPVIALALALGSAIGVGLIANHIATSDTEQSPVFGSYQPTGGNVYKLKNSVTSSQSTINLVSFKEPISNLPYTMTLLGSTVQYATLEPRNPNKSEFVSFTGITQNSDGSATLTGVTRGLPRSNTVVGGCTASTTLQLSHGGQSELILSNSPCQQSEYALKNYDDTIQGYWNIPTPLSSNNPATKAFVESLVNGGEVSYNRIAVAGTAGETVATGTIVYLKQSDARWYKAGTAIAEASSTPIGISQGNGTAGNTIADGVLVAGLDTNQSGLTPGRVYFISSTAGSLAVSTSSRVVGIARDTTSIYLNTSFLVEQILSTTGLIKDSLISTSTIVADNDIATASSSVYYASGSWTKPSNASTVCFNVIGGGAGGSYRWVNGGEGGGGGGHTSGCYSADLVPSPLSFTVGAGGAGAAEVDGTAGTNGGTSTLTFGSIILGAGGGKGGTGGVGGVGGYATGGQASFTGGAGGAGYNGTDQQDAGGGGGGAGGSAGAAGASGVGGAGGAGGTQSDDLGDGSSGDLATLDIDDGGLCGGGGGGGTTGGAPGDGGSGCVRITTTIRN